MSFDKRIQSFDALSVGYKSDRFWLKHSARPRDGLLRGSFIEGRAIPDRSRDERTASSLDPQHALDRIDTSFGQYRDNRLIKPSRHRFLFGSFWFERQAFTHSCGAARPNRRIAEFFDNILELCVCNHVAAGSPWLWLFAGPAFNPEAAAARPDHRTAHRS
jgi:hypothetical protein